MANLRLSTFALCILPLIQIADTLHVPVANPSALLPTTLGAKLQELDSEKNKLAEAIKLQTQTWVQKQADMKIEVDKLKEEEIDLRDRRKWIDKAQAALDKLESQKTMMRLNDELHKLGPFIAATKDKETQLKQKQNQLQNQQQEYLVNRTALEDAQQRILGQLRSMDGSDAPASPSKAASPSQALHPNVLSVPQVNSSTQVPIPTPIATVASPAASSIPSLPTPALNLTQHAQAPGAVDQQGELDMIHQLDQAATAAAEIAGAAPV